MDQRFSFGFSPIRPGDDSIEILPVIMDKIKPIFSATTTATGGNNRHAEISHGSQKTDG